MSIDIFVLELTADTPQRNLGKGTNLSRHDDPEPRGEN